MKTSTTLTVTTTREHFNKYAALVEEKGTMEHLVPATKEEIIHALETGAGHLNEIPLKKWDARSSQVGWTSKRDGQFFKSMAEQVCFLKHVAIYHIAGATPIFKD